MARKKRHGRRADIITKVFRGIFKIGSKLLISAPVTIPLADGVKGAMTGKDFIQEFVYSASGYNVQAKALDTVQLQNVLTRDIILVGVGFGLRWAGRHV